jgi:uncharacterized protein (TIGR03437 family)
MRKLSIVATALFAPLVLSAQTFPPNADVTKAISLVQSNMRVLAISVDSSGNVYLGGESDSAFTDAANKIGPRGSRDLFVIKTNPTVDSVVFSTTIGGSGFDQFRDMKVDSAGNIYLLGATQSSDMPFTKTTNPTNPVGAFMLKLKADGTALTYATQLGSRMNAGTLDIDSSGAAYIAGSTNSQDLAATAGAYKGAPTGGGINGVYGPFVMKLSSDGANFEAVTYYGDVDKIVDKVSVRSNGIMLQYQGNMVLLNAGLTSQTSTTPVGISSGNVAFDSTGNVYWAGANAQGAFAVRKFSPAGQVLLDKTYAFSFNSAPVRIAVANNGRIFLFGQASGEKLAIKNATQSCQANIAAPNGTAGLITIDNAFGGGTAAVPPDNALMILDASGNVLHTTFTSVNAELVATAPSSGHIYTAASETLFTTPAFTSWRGVVRFNQDTIPAEKPIISCLVHGAYFTAVPVTPGSFMTFFGTKIGPSTPVALTALDSNGRVGSSLGGVSVTVDGKAAPMVYSSDTQVNFIAPWAIKTDGSGVPVCVTYQGTQTCGQSSTGVARPGAFDCGYAFSVPQLACARNIDHSVNAPGNGAAPGSAVEIYLTGFGVVPGTLIDGAINAESRPLAGVVTVATTVPDDGCSLFNCAAAVATFIPVEYAGNSGSGVLGFDQINIRIPSDMPSGAQTFRVSYTPNGATLPYITNVVLYIK